MENNKGSEYKNITETWDENEKRRAEGKADASAGDIPASTTTGSDLEQLIKQEAAEYDNENKENRVMSGDRATVNDDQGGMDSDE